MSTAQRRSIWALSGSDWPQMGQIRWFFSDQIQYILALRAKIYWIWSEKTLRFIPFGANRIHFCPNLATLYIEENSKWSLSCGMQRVDTSLATHLITFNIKKTLLQPGYCIKIILNFNDFCNFLYSCVHPQHNNINTVASGSKF